MPSDTPKNFAARLADLNRRIRESELLRAELEQQAAERRADERSVTSPSRSLKF
jgi:hypothetical protein